MKVKGIIISILLSLIALLIMPFSVSAEENVTITTSNIIGITVDNSVGNTSLTGTSMMCLLDDSYIGTLQLNVQVTYYTGSQNANTSGYVTFYFNGNIGYGLLQVGNVVRIRSYTITEQNLSIYESVDNVYGIDYNNFIGYQYWSLYNMSYSNSVSPISSLKTDSFRTISAFGQTSSDPFIRMTAEDLYIGYFTSVNETDNSVSVYVKGASSCTVTVTRIDNDMFTLYTSGDYVFNFYRFHCNKPSGEDDYEFNTVRDRYVVKWANKEGKSVSIIPVWYGMKSGMSEDIQRFLGLIDVDDSSDNLESVTSDFTQTSNDVINVENDIGTGFDTSLHNIPNTFNFNTQFGASFIRSAQWVRDQFNNMTLNNPFGSLITFSLILGVGLLLLGRKLL